MSVRDTKDLINIFFESSKKTGIEIDAADMNLV